MKKLIIFVLLIISVAAYATQPKKESVCDSCSGELIIRPDDKIEAVQKRLETYRNQTAPLIDYYTKKNLIVNIDARPSTDKVLASFTVKFPN